jgi:hypothetical protein
MKQKNVHNLTEDGSWYWIVEVTDGLKWDTVATGYETTEARANEAADAFLNAGSATVRQSDREFGLSIVSAFELQLMESGVNDNLEFAVAVDEFFSPVSGALERGRLHIALKRIQDILDIEESARPFMPISADAMLVPVYNLVAVRVGLPIKE